MVIITTRDTHRLATCSEKELGIGGVAPDSFPIDAFGGEETREGRGRLKEQPACTQVPRILSGRCAIPPPTPFLPWCSTHLGLASSSVHSQSDGESTTNDMDFKEGAKKVAAAQGDHLLWGQG